MLEEEMEKENNDQAIKINKLQSEKSELEEKFNKLKVYIYIYIYSQNIIQNALK